MIQACHEQQEGHLWPPWPLSTSKSLILSLVSRLWLPGMSSRDLFTFPQQNGLRMAVWRTEQDPC